MEVSPQLCLGWVSGARAGLDWASRRNRCQEGHPASHRVEGTEQRSPGPGTARKAVIPTLLLFPDALGTHGREMSPWIYPPFPISLIPPPPLPPPCWNQSSSWHFKGQCARFMAIPYKTILHDNTASPLLGTFGKFIGQTFFCADRWGPAITSGSTWDPLPSPPPLSRVQPCGAGSPRPSSVDCQPHPWAAEVPGCPTSHLQPGEVQQQGHSPQQHFITPCCSHIHQRPINSLEPGKCSCLHARAPWGADFHVLAGWLCTTPHLSTAWLCLGELEGFYISWWGNHSQ